jgi:hypothetical protein
MNQLALPFIRGASVLMIALLLRVPLEAQSAISVYAPSDAGTLMTNGSGAIDGNSVLAPFSTGDNRSSRYQQLNDASLFSMLPPGGGWIVNILVRGDPFLGDPHGGVSFYRIPSVQLNLSTTTLSEGGLSTNFDENTGHNDTVVIARSQQFISFGGGGGGQSYFGGPFFLNPPFYYDPAHGNLLFDFRVYQGGEAVPFFPPGGARLDAFDRPGDGVSSVFAYGVGLPTSGAATSLGLATEFVVIPIPMLTVSLQSSNLLFRWVNQRGGFMLQQSAIIGLGANWQPAGGIVTTNGLYKEVILPLDPEAAARFFRLVLPSPSGSAGVQTSAETIIISSPKH